MTEPANPAIAVDLGLVDEQMQLLDKAFRATQLYLPNNPVYQRALVNLQEGLKKLWPELDELHLRVTKDGFSFEDHPILHGREQGESLAWLLYKDGIRTLTLLPGVEEEEILGFLSVLNKAKALDHGRADAQVEADDDLLTLMWHHDFHCIRYHAIEVGNEDMAELETSQTYGGFAEPEQLQSEMREDVEEGAEEETPAGPPSLDDFDSTLYFLDPQEIEYIKSEIDREYEHDLHLHVLQVLFDILEFQTFDDARTKVIEIVENLIPHFLGVADFQAVAYILAQSRESSSNAAFDQEQRDRLEEIPNRLSSPGALSQLLQILDDAIQKPTEAQIGELFRALQPQSLVTLLTWIPRLHDDRMRSLIAKSVDPLARTHPNAVVNALASDDTAVVLGALGIVIRLELQTVGDHLGRLIRHSDPEVRAELVRAMLVVATPTSMKALVEMVDDVERDIRIAAAQALTERRHTPAAERIEQIVANKLRGAPLKEKQAFFEAYGVLAGEKAIDRLVGIIVGKGMFRRKDDADTKACAAMALGKIGPKARDALEGMGRIKDPVVRNAVDKAIREVS